MYLNKKKVKKKYMTVDIPMTWGWAFVVLTPKPLATNLNLKNSAMFSHTNKKMK